RNELVVGTVMALDRAPDLRQLVSGWVLAAVDDARLEIRAASGKLARKAASHAVADAPDASAAVISGANELDPRPSVTQKKVPPLRRRAERRPFAGVQFRYRGLRVLLAARCEPIPEALSTHFFRALVAGEEVGSKGNLPFVGKSFRYV